MSQLDHSAKKPAALSQQPYVQRFKGFEFRASDYLSDLCSRGHGRQNTGRSRYSKRNQACLACEAERARERRAAKKR